MIPLAPILVDGNIWSVLMKVFIWPIAAIDHMSIKPKRAK
jgi:hypothetical protein